LDAKLMAALLLALRPARAHPEWAPNKIADAADAADGSTQAAPASPARERQLQGVTSALRPLALQVNCR
jgi:hypothetical protein